MIQAKLYIDGQWIDSQSKRSTTRKNPANLSESVGVYPLATEDETDSAIAAAKHALLGWKALPGSARGDILYRAAQLLENDVSDVAKLMSREMGKPIGEAIGEVKRGVALLRYYAGEGTRAMGEVYPASDGGSLLYSNRVPIGVVGVITPWNFPVAIPLWKMAPALIFGNTVVWKPADPSSITAYRLMQILDQAGFPKGVINMVTGKGSEVGQKIIMHPSIHAITFTGSNEVGKLVALAAAERGAKYQLEMGGKNPTIVCADADLEKAAQLTVSAAMRSSGQKCTATSRVIVERSILETFTAMLVEKVSQLKLSDPLEQDCYLGPVVNETQQQSILAAIERGMDSGARLLVGGRALVGELANGCFVQPTLFDQVDPQSELGQHEIFGPVLSIIPADDLTQALEIANDTPFGLSAAIFTKDIDRMFRFLRNIEAGLIKINGETAGVEPHAPFGGMKQSSSHSREQGRAAIEFFTSIQTIAISQSSL
jgi:acyl-CoA reductase-like NAD-dependent aldehyde dehydrogenase